MQRVCARAQQAAPVCVYWCTLSIPLSSTGALDLRSLFKQPHNPTLQLYALSQHPCSHSSRPALWGDREFSSSPSSTPGKVEQRRVAQQQQQQQKQQVEQRESLFTLSNSISLARLASSPLLAWWIVTEQWHLCLPGLVLAGVSDWADGYVAKHYNQKSVLGSYLDPLADKAVIGAVVGSLGWSGALSPAVVAVLLGRDAMLVAGGFYHRARTLRWQVGNPREFFRTVPAHGKEAVKAIEPLLVSKLNTALQFALVACCMCQRMIGWPEETITDALIASTLATTVVSGVQYWRLFVNGKLM